MSSASAAYTFLRTRVRERTLVTRYSSTMCSESLGTSIFTVNSGLQREGLRMSSTMHGIVTFRVVFGNLGGKEFWGPPAQLFLTPWLPAVIIFA